MVRMYIKGSVCLSDDFVPSYAMLTTQPAAYPILAQFVLGPLLQTWINFNFSMEK